MEALTCTRVRVTIESQPGGRAIEGVGTGGVEGLPTSGESSTNGDVTGCGRGNGLQRSNPSVHELSIGDDIGIDVVVFAVTNGCEIKLEV